MHFPSFVIISPLKRVWPFLWTNLNNLHPRMFFLSSLFKYWSCGSEEKDFYFIFFIVFFCFAFSLLSPLWKGRGPTFEQFWIRFNKRMLCAKCGWNFPSGSGEEDESVKRRLQRRRGQRANFDLMLSKNLTELKLIITSNYNWISKILNLNLRMLPWSAVCRYWIWYCAFFV